MIYSVTYWSDDEATLCEVDECIRPAEVLVTSLMGEIGYLCNQDWIGLRVQLVQSGNDIVGDVTMWDRRLSPGRGFTWSVYPCQVRRQSRAVREITWERHRRAPAPQISESPTSGGDFLRYGIAFQAGRALLGPSGDSHIHSGRVVPRAEGGRSPGQFQRPAWGSSSLPRTRSRTRNRNTIGSGC